jgi:hypothetical protein
MTATTTTLGTLKAKSGPNVFDGKVWFQEDETSKLIVMPIERPAGAYNPQGFSVGSMPQLCDDGFVYFQSADDKLVVMKQDYPHLYCVVEGVGCMDTPEAPNDGYVYVRSSAGSGKLARVAVTPAEFGEVTYYEAFTGWTPAVYIRDDLQRAFFADAKSRKLKKIDLDSTSNTASEVGDYELYGAPYMGEHGKLYIVDKSHDAYEIDPVTFAATKIASDVVSTPVTPEFGDDGYVYWQTIGDKLLMAPRNATFTPTIELGTTTAQPDVLGSGRVVFRALDSTLKLRDPGVD